MSESKDILNVIEERKSIRGFEDRPVEKEKLLKIVEAARLAPTARNRQEWKTIIITDRKIIKEMVKVCNGQKWVETAGAIFVPVSTENEYIMRCGVNGGVVDTTIVLQTIVLEAQNQGLGSCYIGSFYQDKIKKLLNIPEKYRVIQVLPVGYPKAEGGPRKRKEIEEFYSFERYE
mgnify:CR=1 FL=1